MEIQALISPKRTLCRVEGGSKKRALELLANTIAQDVTHIDAEDLFRRLIARERLGSTGIGYGIAIPHCRVENCQGTVGALITLTEPVDFDAIDSQPVDILFAMLVPEEAHDEHLQTLSSLVNALNKAEYRDKLRAAASDQDLYEAAIS
ncbi:PTS IIA-like nitrogen regulatory protein PtsN [Cellvibrio japonicus]|uniref:Phosphotransferase enzyme IIA n=1 Tax=Cellvibrio japonicus (strain Ueda107) TaxID=498211 RepID=B3PBZ7_CELJU|nr:PTS IIA-like nitrogen regulatory protein PtsN [Cellvibrio japonicus]ACE85624.1 phosphotransferase enzyme IIA [Cellvibrio japonicus Ueda107]QEI13152.1 PTS IIA-like nitrogen regulatory protein PtsN [Cellvibrio japonicus]QEI16726.1 PTS IIA-like nitrogen regulatory protein PtsN [Cellvibrio japonicus]QEI20304.1 PTS IIA-like nitrogen regulatory protein PtsN [Cellvibrio japonicus]